MHWPYSALRHITLGLGIALLLGAILAGEPVPERHQEVLRSGGSRYHTYGIPAMVATPGGGVVILLEGRRRSLSDWGAIDLLSVRSPDGGRTWGEPQVVWTEGKAEEGISIGNACPVYDADTGRLWCMFNRENQEVFVTYSDNDGRSWAFPREITKDVRPPRWSRYWTGPGHGLQLKHGPKPGRLLFPSNHVIIESSDGGFTYQMNLRSHMVYSDDHGETWKIGGSTELAREFDRSRAHFAGGAWLPGEGGTWHGSECMAAEMSDGRLYLIIRNEAHYDDKKAYAWSSDAGETWTSVKLQPQLPDTRCQASIIRWEDPTDSKAVIYLYSGITRDDRPIRKTLDSADPDSKKPGTARLNAPIGRHRLALFASTDQCQTWSEIGLIQPGCASYSDLAVLPGGDLLCVYEGGERSAYESIRVARFTSDWLRQRIRQGSTSP